MIWWGECWLGSEATPSPVKKTAPYLNKAMAKDSQMPLANSKCDALSSKAPRFSAANVSQG